jgi:hypothetical protein
LLLAASSAQAAAKHSKENKERAARKACLAGDFAKGVEILSDLFVDSKDPTYIYNQGRCYEQNNHWEDAIGRFREFIRTSKEDTSEAKAHIAECETLIAKRDGIAPTSVAAEVPRPASEVAPIQPTVAASLNPEVATVVDRAQPPAGDGSGLRIAGVVITSIGGAALIGGVILNLKANSVSDSITPPNTFQRNTESQWETYRTLSWVGYGVGAACVATGAILYLVGRSSNRADAPSVALVPVVAADQAGALVRGTF